MVDVGGNEVLVHAGPDEVAEALAARLMARLVEIQREFRVPQVGMTGGRIAIKAYERLTIRAALSGERALSRAALAANPLAGDPDRADELLDAVFEVNARWLPRFFPNG